MSLFVSVVLWNVVKIISSDDNGSLHFSGDADTLENFPLMETLLVNGHFLST